MKDTCLYTHLSLPKAISSMWDSALLDRETVPMPHSGYKDH